MTPLFYHSTQVLLVSDTATWFDDWQLFLLARGITLQLCEQIPTAIKLLTESQHNLQIQNNRYINQVTVNEHDLNDSSSTQSLDNLYKLMYETCKNLQISVVIVDEKIAGYSGIAFSKMLDGLPVKIILISKETNLPQTINALSDGIIDSYLLSYDMNGKALITIMKMQTKYFQDLTYAIGFNRDLDKYKSFATVFNQFIEQHQVIEYYALDKFGSYVARSQDNHLHWLIIWPDYKFDQFVAIAKDQGAETEVIKQLAKKTHGLFLFSETEKRLPVLIWSHYLFKVAGHFLVNDKIYYYAVISNKNFSLTHPVSRD